MHRQSWLHLDLHGTSRLLRRESILLRHESWRGALTAVGIVLLLMAILRALSWGSTCGSNLLGKPGLFIRYQLEIVFGILNFTPWFNLWINRNLLSWIGYKKVRARYFALKGFWATLDYLFVLHPLRLQKVLLITLYIIDDTWNLVLKVVWVCQVHRLL